MVASSSWFVKVDGKIRGPFNLSQLQSMKERGRIAADTEVSQDRASWVFAVSIPELFGEIISVAPGGVATGAGEQIPAARLPAMAPPQAPLPQHPTTGMAPASMPAAPVPTPLPPAPTQYPAGEMMPHPGVGNLAQTLAPTSEFDPECYYQVDGIQQGPVRLSGIRDLITVGTLKPNDFVWLQGSPTWVQVQDVPQLAVPDQVTRATKHFRASPILISCVGMIATLIIALPTWYVLSADSHKEQLREEAAALLEKERQEKLRLEQIAREESHRLQDLTIDERRHREEMALLDRDNDQFDKNVQLKEDEIAVQHAGFDKMAGALGDFKQKTNSKIATADAKATKAQQGADAAALAAAQAQAQADAAQAKADAAQADADMAKSDLDRYKKEPKEFDLETDSGKKIGEGVIKPK